eukprot:8943161-Heterocapsa_arctica.AAC.1
MNHTGPSTLKDIKIGTRNFGITLGDARAARFPKDAQLLTSFDNLSRAVGTHSLDFISSSKELKRNHCVL